MSKKSDLGLGLIIVLVMVVSAAAKFVEEHLTAVISIICVVMGLVLLKYLLFRSRKGELSFTPSANSTETTSSDTIYAQNVTVTLHHPYPIRDQPDFFHHGIPLNCNLHLKYKEDNGEIVERDVGVEQFDGERFFEGYCHQLNDRAVFDYTRVVECVDRFTGEIVSENIRRFFWNKYENTGFSYLSKMRGNEKDTLKSLLYIFKADNVLRKNKRVMFHKAIRELASTDEFTDQDLDKLISEIDRMTVHAFKLATGRLHKNYPERFELVHRYCKELASSSKKLHPAEAEALDFLDRKSKQK